MICLTFSRLRLTQRRARCELGASWHEASDEKSEPKPKDRPTGAIAARFLMARMCPLFGLIGGRTAALPFFDFNRDIRPILSENCFYCHGQDANKRQAGLRLECANAAIEAGAIVPKDTDVERTDRADLLGRSTSSCRLRSRIGGCRPSRRSSSSMDRPRGPCMLRTGPTSPRRAGRAPVSEPPGCAIPSTVRPRQAEAEGLAPSPEADRVTLIRRLSIDLAGLPPTPEEVDAFVADPDPEAYEKLVDRLLASQHYGERMALGWLDAARYADSNGFQQDGDTWQWIWRDWVVRALNDDLPFDQFTIWQLAGDLLAQTRPSIRKSPAASIATICSTAKEARSPRSSVS